MTPQEFRDNLGKTCVLDPPWFDLYNSGILLKIREVDTEEGEIINDFVFTMCKDGIPAGCLSSLDEKRLFNFIFQERKI